MDPGVDAAIMLLLAINDPNLEVLAVTAVSDNVNVNKATTNALKVIEARGMKSVPVCMGAKRPLKRRSMGLCRRAHYLTT